MQTLTTDIVAGPHHGLLSGRPNGGRKPRRISRYEWDRSEHVLLDTRLRHLPPRSVWQCLPLDAIESPGHSWMFAELGHVAALGVADEISSCSYIVGPYAALEEDCDAPAFAKAAGRHIDGGFDWNRHVRPVYDELFDWDSAYENMEAAGPPHGCILRPYDGKEALRIASAVAAATATAAAATAAAEGEHAGRQAPIIPAGAPRRGGRGA